MAGGVLGAAVRWAVQASAAVPAGFPWATFAVNVVGCLLLGGLTSLVRARPHHRPLAGDLLGVGFCGGLTTMSTLAVELAAFGREDRMGLAALYLASSLVVGVAAAWGGARAEERILEGER
jgi:CrcB protein